MNKIDSFVNTRAKRNCVLMIFTFSMLVIITSVHLYLGMIIMKAETYEQIFSLLNTNAVSLSFLGRMSVTFMSVTKFEVLRLLTDFFSSIYLYEFIFFLVSVIVICAKAKTKMERQIKRFLMIHWAIFVILILSLAICAMLALKAGSLFNAFSLLRFFGYMLIGINGLLLVIDGFALCSCILIDLPEAMAYRVEEIEG